MKGNNNVSQISNRTITAEKEMTLPSFFYLINLQHSLTVNKAISNSTLHPQNQVNKQPADSRSYNTSHYASVGNTAGGILTNGRVALADAKCQTEKYSCKTSSVSLFFFVKSFIHFAEWLALTVTRSKTLCMNNEFNGDGLQLAVNSYVDSSLHSFL